MWFMAAEGDPTYDGTNPNAIRVTKMENVLSDSPVFTDYSVTVNTYGPNIGAADQPGAQAQWRPTTSRPPRPTIATV